MGHEKTVVSVIIPAFNRESVINRAIDSVLSQTYKWYEIIVCDDGSTDRTCDVVGQYTDSRVRLLKLDSNQGAAAARNAAMGAAAGEYLAFLDSDDEWLPDKLTRQIAVMQSVSSRVGVCFCGGRIIKNGSATTRYVPRQEWEDQPYRAFVMDRLSFLTSTIIMRTECFRRVGGMDLELRRSQDCEFLLRVFREYGLVVIPDELVVMHLEMGKDVWGAAKHGVFAMYQKHRDHVRKELGRRCARVFEAGTYWRMMLADINRRDYLPAISNGLRSLCAMPSIRLTRWKSLVGALGRSLRGSR